MKKVEDYVRSIPDFPEPGIIFRDVTSILQDADGLQLAIDEMRHFVEEENFLWRPSRRAMTWSTAAQRSRCTKTPSNRARR